ncbi:MAG: hypothetical protein QW100_02360 [Thermoplasmatales archaeon]
MDANSIEMVLGIALGLFLWYAAYKVARDIGTGLAHIVNWWADRRARAGR